MSSFPRRAAICFVLGALASPWLLAQALPPAPDRPERTKIPAQAASLEIVGRHEPTLISPNEPLPVRQGHVGPEVFSIKVGMHPLLARYLQLYTSPAWLDWMKVILKRADPFLGYIASRIARYHLPPELLYLPIAESSYDPYAVSRAGAAGLWQLMVQTATSQHLTINKWNDQRFDFWKATDASLQTLKKNYETLKSWPLALAAYDAGLGFIERLVEKTGIHDYWTLAADGYLPQETTDYVPRFFAIAAICSYPGRYGLPVSWSRPIEWARIRLDGAVDLHLLADQAGVNRSLLMEGNAGLRYGVTPPQGGSSYLAIPKADSGSVAKALEGSRYDLMRFYIYNVHSGDTLDRLSAYYGVPVSLILTYNPGVTAGTIKAGTDLLIPAIKNLPPYHTPPPRPAASVVPASVVPASAPPFTAVSASVVPASAPPAPAAPPAAPPKSGQTALPSAAEATTPAAIATKPGPPPVALPALVVPAGAPLPQPPAQSGNQVSNSYIVAKGDTLWSIAQRFGTTAAQIARINGLNLADIIYPGLVLRLPPGR